MTDETTVDPSATPATDAPATDATATDMPEATPETPVVEETPQV